MKKILLILTGMLIAFVAYSQVPQAFKYQAVVRDNSGNLMTDQSIDFQIDILQGTVDGTTVYSETHSALSNAYGLVTLEIGKGVTTDDFSAIEWGTDSYFITLWVNGDEMGTSQLLSVPYALHAKTAGTFTGAQIKNLTDPTEDQDAATKAYVDRQITNPGVRIQAVVDSIICYGDNSGAIDLTITGGTSPYTFEWDDGSTYEDLAAISQGKYQIYVEDSEGVTAFRHFTLHAPEEIVISHIATPGTGEINITVTGGIIPYSYLWSNGSTDEDLTGLDGGVYTVQVTDANGCSISKEIELYIRESRVLAEYLESAGSPAGKYYVNTDMPSIRTAAHVKSLMAAGLVYIIDLRSSSDYAAGHIEGAVNVAAGDVLSHIESVDLSGYDEVSIIGYTGQIASWATSLLRLMGHDNVYFMKWGMCSWHQDFAAPWQNNIGNGYATQFITDPTEKGPEGDLPQITTGGSTVQEILEARIDAVLAEGFGAAAITAATVFGSLDNYYIINYWPASDYIDPGHISGAIQYTPKESIALEVDLKTLPTDKTVVVYEYTGHSSAGLVAYLRLLGYDAKSVKFGANGMIYDEMISSKWSEALIMGYAYVTE